MKLQRRVEVSIQGRRQGLQADRLHADGPAEHTRCASFSGQRADNDAPLAAITTDQFGSYSKTLCRLQREGKLPQDMKRPVSKYLNNIIEADHGALKRVIGPTRVGISRTLVTIRTAIYLFNPIAIRTPNSTSQRCARVCGCTPMTHSAVSRAWVMQMHQRPVQVIGISTSSCGTGRTVSWS